MIVRQVPSCFSGWGAFEARIYELQGINKVSVDLDQQRGKSEKFWNNQYLSWIKDFEEAWVEVVPFM